MALSREEVEHVALLARISLSDDERERLSGQLGAILDYVAQLSELDTSNVEPMAHVAAVGNVLRPDVPRPGTPTDEILSNAPDRTENTYKVPRVIE